MNNSPVDRFIRHPRRRWIVGAVTCVVGVIFLLPAVDSFSAACSNRDALLTQLDSGREDLARLPAWQSRLAEQTARLSELQSHRLTDETVESFRSELVELEHREHCRLRRIHIDEPRLRDWLQNGDNPLEDRPPLEAEGETPFHLKSRTLLLSVEGPLGRIHELLKEIQTTDRLVHSSGFAIRPVDGEAGLVALDLELVLFDLVRKSDDQES